MIEHLAQKALKKFLDEAYRILKTGGIIRIAVPDLHYHINIYNINGDAEKFMTSIAVAPKVVTGFVANIQYLIIVDISGCMMVAP